MGEGEISQRETEIHFFSEIFFMPDEFCAKHSPTSIYLLKWRIWVSQPPVSHQSISALPGFWIEINLIDDH